MNNTHLLYVDITKNKFITNRFCFPIKKCKNIITNKIRLNIVTYKNNILYFYNNNNNIAQLQVIIQCPFHKYKLTNNREKI